MTKFEFAQAISNNIENSEVKICEKANCVVKTGIRIGNNDISPVIYIDEMYENDLCVDCATEEVIKIYNDCSKELPFDYSRIGEWDWSKDRLEARLLNDCTHAEIYGYADEFGFEDLIIVPYVRLSDEAVVKVTKSLADNWDVPEWMIIEKALMNTSHKKYIFKSMFETLYDLMPDLPMIPCEHDEKMFVLSNETRVFGAIEILFCKEMLENKFPNGYIVIPSSIHEVIVLKYDGTFNRNDLYNMINEVNNNEVSPEEQLSDHAYFFNCEVEKDED